MKRYADAPYAWTERPHQSLRYPNPHERHLERTKSNLTSSLIHRPHHCESFPVQHHIDIAYNMACYSQIPATDRAIQY